MYVAAWEEPRMEQSRESRIAINEDWGLRYSAVVILFLAREGASLDGRAEVGGEHRYAKRYLNCHSLPGTTAKTAVGMPRPVLVSAPVSAAISPLSSLESA